MSNMLLRYSALFKHLTPWCFRTAIAQFVVFLFIFLGVSYLSTLMEIDYQKETVSKYEKYVVLAASLYMIVPFSFSNLFLFGLFHKNPVILKVFILGSVVNFGVILIAVIGSGIYLAIEGTDYIAYSLIGAGVCLESHGMLLVHGTRRKYLQNVEPESTHAEENNHEM